MTRSTQLLFAALMVLVMGAVVLWSTGAWRFVCTGWLIWRVEPFQQQVEYGPTILVLGDSTAYGTGATRSEDSIAGLMGERYPDYTVITKARNGLTTIGLAQLLEDWLGEEHYQLVLVQVGGNDILQSVATSTSMQTMEEVIHRVQQQTQQVVWMSVGNVGSAPAFLSNESRSSSLEAASVEFHRAARQLADTVGVTYIDFFRARDVDPFVLESHLYMAADGLHPSSRGYQQWFDVLQPVLDDVLQETSLEEV